MFGVCTSNVSVVQQPVDPNEKGILADRFLRPDQSLPYVIHFENVGSVAARDIFLTDAFDAGLDLTAVRLMHPLSGQFLPILPGETVTLLDRIKEVNDGGIIITINEKWTATLDGSTLRWELRGIELPPGETGEVLFEARPIVFVYRAKSPGLLGLGDRSRSGDDGPFVALA